MKSIISLTVVLYLFCYAHFAWKTPSSKKNFDANELEYSVKIILIFCNFKKNLFIFKGKIVIVKGAPCEIEKKRETDIRLSIGIVFVLMKTLVVYRA